MRNRTAHCLFWQLTKRIWNNKHKLKSLQVRHHLNGILFSSISTNWQPIFNVELVPIFFFHIPCFCIDALQSNYFEFILTNGLWSSVGHADFQDTTEAYICACLAYMYVTSIAIIHSKLWQSNPQNQLGVNNSMFFQLHWFAIIPPIWFIYSFIWIIVISISDSDGLRNGSKRHAHKTLFGLAWDVSSNLTHYHSLRISCTNCRWMIKPLLLQSYILKLGDEGHILRTPTKWLSRSNNLFYSKYMTFTSDRTQISRAEAQSREALKSVVTDFGHSMGEIGIVSSCGLTVFCR